MLGVMMHVLHKLHSFTKAWMNTTQTKWWSAVVTDQSEIFELDNCTW